MSKLSSYINEHLSIADEYELVFHKTLPSGKFFCPFHTNVNTPSAKVYQNRIKCFGQCQRSYSVYDFLKRFNPERIEEINSTVILPDEQKSTRQSFKIVTVDLSKSRFENYQNILNENGLSENRVQ